MYRNGFLIKSEIIVLLWLRKITWITLDLASQFLTKKHLQVHLKYSKYLCKPCLVQKESIKFKVRSNVVIMCGANYDLYTVQPSINNKFRYQRIRPKTQYNVPDYTPDGKIQHCKIQRGSLRNWGWGEYWMCEKGSNGRDEKNCVTRRFIIYTFRKALRVLGWSLHGELMAGACRSYGRDNKWTQNFCRKIWKKENI